MFKIVIAATALTACLTAGALAANNSNSQGLVNVTLGDVTLLNNIANNLHVNASQIAQNIQVPVGVAANVCGVDANVLAKQKNGGTATCAAKNSSAAFENLIQKSLVTQ